MLNVLMLREHSDQKAGLDILCLRKMLGFKFVSMGGFNGPNSFFMFAKFSCTAT